MAKDTPNNSEEPLTPTEVDTAGGTEAEAKKKKIKKIIIIAAPILISIIGAVLFFIFVVKAPKKVEIAPPGQSKGKENVELEHNTYLDLDKMTVPLSSANGKREYLRIDMVLRLNSQEESKIVMDKLPIIKDTLLTFLRSLRSSDFNTSSSTLALKEEITKRINKIVSPILIKEVLFQEITVN